jgi:hypothetical protein
VSERGVFAVDRGIFEHPKFRDDKHELSKLEAWLWLLSSAAWKPHVRRVSGKNFKLSRGQLVASTRYMAERWRWSESKVRRFLDALKTDGDSDAEIDAATDAGVTVITIRKYDKYQRVSLPSDADNDAVSGAQSDAAATQDRRNKENIQRKEDISEAKASGAAAPVYTDSRHELWGEGVSILISLGVADKQARSMIGLWLKSTKDDVHAVLGAVLRARDHRPHNPIPWITNALKVPHEQTARQNRTNSAAGSAPPRDVAVIAGMGRALERRRAARVTDDAGRQDVREAGCVGTAGGADADRGTAAGDGELSGQLAFLPTGHARG